MITLDNFENVVPFCSLQNKKMKNICHLSQIVF